MSLTQKKTVRVEEFQPSQICLTFPQTDIYVHGTITWRLFSKFVFTTKKHFICMSNTSLVLEQTFNKLERLKSYVSSMSFKSLKDDLKIVL